MSGRLSALLVLLLVLLVGCADASIGQPEPPAPVPAVEEPPEPSEMVVGVDDLGVGFNPHLIAHTSPLTTAVASLVLPSVFRPDASGTVAYLVDAETAEMHTHLSAGQRDFDISYASERVGGELFDLQAGGLLPPDVDPIEVAAELPARYRALWDELTREELIPPDEQRYRVAERIDRLNEMGFDVDEIELVTTDEGTRLTVHTRVAEVGRKRQELFGLVGLEVAERQARRLLNDVRSYRGYLEQKEGRAVPETVAAHRWRSEVYDKVAWSSFGRRRATPAEKVISSFSLSCRKKCLVSSRCRRTMVCTADSTVVSVIRIMNSSPPKRAITSIERSVPFTTLARWRRALSPARWP